MTAPGVSVTRAELSRKLIHLSSAALPVAWASGVLASTSIRALLVVAVAAALGVEWGRRASPALRARFMALVGGLLRPHEERALTGATWLAIGMLLAVILMPEHAARTALWAGAVGDASAALAGRLWQARSHAASTGKSHVGSITCAAVTAIGALWVGGATITVAAAVGVVAALAERPKSPGDDNLRITLAAGGAAWLLGVG